MEAKKVSRIDNLEVIYQEFVAAGKSVKATALKEEYLSRFGDDKPASLTTIIYSFLNKKNSEEGKTSNVVSVSSVSDVTPVVEKDVAPVAPVAVVSSYSVVSGDLSFMKVPEQNPTYHINKADQGFLDVVDADSKAGIITNIMLIGSHGCGKTEMAKEFAARTGRHFFHTNCALYREPRDFYGYKGANNGSTYWRKSDFVQAIERPNTVILLDEFNRCSPMVANSLFNLLDDNRCAVFDEIGEVKVGAGNVIFGTINRGVQYTGTMISDAAVMDRFGNTIEVNYLPDNLEIDVLVKRTGIKKEDAKMLVQLGNTIRTKAGEMGSTIRSSVSTRLLIKTAERYKTMGKDAFKYTILPLYSKEGGANSERSQVTQMIQMVFGD